MSDDRRSTQSTPQGPPASSSPATGRRAAELGTTPSDSLPLSSPLSSDQLNYTSPPTDGDELAMEDNRANVIRDDNDEIHEEDDGEDLLENMEDDYRYIPELDEYEKEGLSSGDDNEMDADARIAAERAMRKRDREERRRQEREGNANAILDQTSDEDEEDEDADMEATQRRQRRRRETAAQDVNAIENANIGMEEFDDDVDDIRLNVDDVEGPLSEWISRTDVRRSIAKSFKSFLETYTRKDGDGVYMERIKRMCANNKESLEVSYQHLGEEHQVLAAWVADAPKEMLEIFDKVAYAVVLNAFPQYDKIKQQVHVRMADLPLSDKLRDLRQEHLNWLVKVPGVITRRTGVFPQLQQVKYDCGKCGFLLGPFVQTDASEIKVSSCPECQSKGPFTINVEQTIYRNFQKVTLQEAPGTVPAGRLPRQKDVILTHDLIDTVRPGEEVEVTGIYHNCYDAYLNVKNGFPVFQTQLTANFIAKKEDPFRVDLLTDDDKDMVRSLGNDPRIGERIFKSIASSIYGNDHIKQCVALSMFGGQPKDIAGKHRLRGDINVLMLGDPGTAKSQFLKYLEKTSPRAVYTTGKGASAVGLTAGVHKDPITREWTLEGGALVLADRGMCLIDEFDKMNDADRTSIHEAMEQQSISISKAGIVTSLHARCSVVAAANPVRGRYDQSLTFAQNVDLSEPILSRFDCLCVLKDIVDPSNDEYLARFVVSSHMSAHPDKERADEATKVASALKSRTYTTAMGATVGGDDDDHDDEILSQDTIRKYVQYARQHIHPRLHQIDEDKIQRLYAELRRESTVADGQMIAVRHLESIIRLSEAHARMHLRDYVKDEDTDMAIRIILESFCSTQKFAAMRSLQKVFQKYITYKKDTDDILMHILEQFTNRQVRYMQVKSNIQFGQIDVVEIREEEFQRRAKEVGITDLQRFYNSAVFAKNNYTLSRQGDRIMKRLHAAAEEERPLDNNNSSEAFPTSEVY